MIEKIAYAVLGLAAASVALLLVGFVWLSAFLWWNARTMNHEWTVRRYGWWEL